VNDDHNPKLFHCCAATKKHNSTIMRLKDDVEVWVTELHLILQKFIDKFMRRFTSSRNSSNALPSLNIASQVSLDESVELIKPITEHEIREVVFHMDPYKAPGPDGFGPSFFQHHWPIIGEKVV